LVCISTRQDTHEEIVMMNRRHFIATSIASSLAGRADASFASPLTGKRSLLIDSHVHVWKHDPAFPFAQGAHPPPEDASVETLLELMEANAVDRTVLIQVIHYRWDNSYLANVLSVTPAGLKPYAVSIRRTPGHLISSVVSRRSKDFTVSASALAQAKKGIGFAIHSCVHCGGVAHSSKFR
jgi:hypothetical protein